MSGFETLLNKVKEAKLITEEEATAMLSEYDAARQDEIDQAVSAAEGSAFKDGYNQGFTNAKQQADADTKKALDELLAKCDEEATVKLQTVIDSINDSHAQKIQEIYDLMVAQRDAALKVAEQAMTAMDEDHASKLEQVLDAKDNYDAGKLVEACEAIKAASNKKILATESFMNKKMAAKSALYEKQIASLKDEKNQKMNTLAESVEKYLNYALQKSIPSKALVSEAKYNASQKAIEKIISILKINSVIQESKDGIFQEYENKIKEAQDQTNKVMLENISLKSKISKNEAQLVLESKIKNCTPAEAAYLRKYFERATSSKIIEEQIEDARANYKKMADERRSSLQRKIEGIKPSPVNGKIVGESKTKIENESSKKTATTKADTAAENQPKSIYDTYAEFLKNNKI